MKTTTSEEEERRKREKKERKDKEKAQRRKEREEEDEANELGGEAWQVQGKGLQAKPKMFAKDADINTSVVVKKLSEILAARGKKGEFYFVVCNTMIVEKPHIINRNWSKGTGRNASRAVPNLWSQQSWRGSGC